MKFPEIGGGKREGQGGSSLYVRMKNGDRVTGIFRGDPHIFRLHWIDGKSQTCPGKAECANCEAGDKPKFRFKINFMVQEDGVWLAKIFEQGYGTFKDMKAMHENDYNLEETLVVITRQGERTDTRYNILPARKQLPPSELKKIAAIPLNDINGSGAKEAHTPAPEESEEDLPF